MNTRPLFLFAPGAGAPSSHPWMQQWATLLGTLGKVQTMDYAYMEERRGRPDPLPMLVETHRTKLKQLRAVNEGPVVLAGKSMGSRVGCHVSTKEPVTALVCFGYPLCGGGDATKLRDKVLRELTTPILFIQGTRDALCPLELLEPIRATMSPFTQLHVVEEGDHSLQVTRRWLKAHGKTQLDVDQEILAVIERFLAPLVAAPST